jgi:hypothetical protein
MSLLYEAGQIRYIKLDDNEVVRRIYVTLRDQHWMTILPHISNLEIFAEEDCFELTFDARHQQGNINFSWRGRVHGDRRGVITFSMDGRAGSNFLQNRVGLCVLHPIRGLAGTVCTVEHTDRSKTDCEFPLDVAPHQPFTDIRAIQHKVGDNRDAIIHFEGSAFEIEDQRNWTDGSYKTYSPPLSVPYPSQINTGTRILQTVSIELNSISPGLPMQIVASSPTLTIAAEPSGTLPKIGFGFAEECEPLSGERMERTKRLRPAHLRIDLQLSDPGYVSVLEGSSKEASGLGTLLEVGLILSDDLREQMEDLLRILERVKPSVNSWLVFNAHGQPGTTELVYEARKYLMEYDNRSLIGTGSNENFVELNRVRPHPQGLDFVCYPANPQIHASDNDTLIEALDAQGWTVASAKKFAEGLPVFITPVTFKPRHCPNTTDPRQFSMFGAVWTLGSLKYLAEGGASSITYFETQGPRGIQTKENRLTGAKPTSSSRDWVFPLYHVLADASEYCGAKVVPTRASHPLRVEGLTLLGKDKLGLLCGNFTERTESVVIQGLPSVRAANLWRLDAENVEQAMLSPEEFRARAPTKIPAPAELRLELPPFGLVRIDAEVRP